MKRKRKIQIDFTDIDSSTIDSIQFIHDQLDLSDAGKLIVVFHSGDMYKYYNVSFQTVFDLITAESVGKYFINNIRNNYGFTKLS